MDDELEIGSGRSWEQYWDSAKRRRWWIIAPAFFIWAVALAGSYYLPPRYRSETVILVEQQKIPSQYVTPNVTVDLQSRLHSLTEQILSRTRLLRIIDEFHLYGRGRKDSDALVHRMRDDIEITLVRGDRADELSGFKISYSAPEAQIAQQVTGRLTSFFIDENLRNQQKLSEDTTQFLESQLEGARKELESQEERMRQFRSRYLGELPDQLQSNVQILGGLQGRLDAATEALNRAEQQNLYLTSVLAQPRNSLSSETGTSSSIDKQMDRLKAELAVASSRYKATHPDVVHLKQQIAETEQLKKRLEKGNAAKSATTTGAGGESVRSGDSPGDSLESQLQGQLKANHMEVAHRKKEINDLEHQINQYQGRLNLTPVREQEMAALTRNYNQSRSNYESLLAKKMQSQMATNLERRQQGEQFRVLDPANLPQRPYWPNRLKIALGALAAGLFLGTTAAALKEFTNLCIYSDQDLANFPTLRVLAVVPPVLTVGEERSRFHRFRLELVLAVLIFITVPVLTALTSIRP
jgi:succinoglycan biosynthesis transport protein ExoP